MIYSKLILSVILIWVHFNDTVFNIYELAVSKYITEKKHYKNNYK